MNIFYQFVRHLKLFGCFKEFVFTHTSNVGNFTVHFSHMADCLNNITGTRFSFGPDHGSTFGDSSQSFTQIFGTTYKWNFEISFVNMIDIICRGENFAFINVINFKSFQNLSFCEVANTTFCHNWNGNSILDVFD